MRKVNVVKDMSGREVEKGDTVCTLNGQISGKIAELAQDDMTAFVRLRPVHQPYGPAVWHAADRVLWQADGKQKKQRLRDEAAQAADAAADPTPTPATSAKSSATKQKAASTKAAKTTAPTRKK